MTVDHEDSRVCVRRTIEEARRSPIWCSVISDGGIRRRKKPPLLAKSLRKNKKEREIAMRKIMLFGATAIALALGAANAYAIGGRNLSPEQSPYAVIAPQTLTPSPLSEGRAVYTGEDLGFTSSYGVQPEPFVTPEQRNVYSRGR
jgi:hypothetical protein